MGLRLRPIAYSRLRQRAVGVRLNTALSPPNTKLNIIHVYFNYKIGYTSGQNNIGYTSMTFFASAISTTAGKVSLTTASIVTAIALGTTGANAVALAGTTINTTVGVGATSTVAGTFSGSDTIVLNASGTVDNLAAFGPNGYTTNAAGIVTASNQGFIPGDFFANGSGIFTSGALLIGNNTIGFQQVFAINPANGAFSNTPPTALSRTTTLATIFGSGFTNTNSLQFKIEPYFFSGGPSATVGSSATVGGLIPSVPSFASVPNVYTLTGSITQAGTPTSVPEPFTIVGTLIGGTAALRLRKKLKADRK